MSQRRHKRTRSSKTRKSNPWGWKAGEQFPEVMDGVMEGILAGSGLLFMFHIFIWEEMKQVRV